MVFDAGAGPGSGAERKLTMDRDGAIKLIRAATSSGVSRYVMVSGAGVENPSSADEVFEVYLGAKAQADTALTRKRSGVDDFAARRANRRPWDRERPHRGDPLQRSRLT